MRCGVGLARSRTLARHDPLKNGNGAVPPPAHLRSRRGTGGGHLFLGVGRSVRLLPTATDAAMSARARAPSAPSRRERSVRSMLPRLRPRERAEGRRAQLRATSRGIGPPQARGGAGGGGGCGRDRSAHTRAGASDDDGSGRRVEGRGGDGRRKSRGGAPTTRVKRSTVRQGGHGARETERVCSRRPRARSSTRPRPGQPTHVRLDSTSPASVPGACTSLSRRQTRGGSTVPERSGGGDGRTGGETRGGGREAERTKQGGCRARAEGEREDGPHGGKGAESATQGRSRGGGQGAEGGQRGHRGEGGGGGGA